MFGTKFWSTPSVFSPRSDLYCTSILQTKNARVHWKRNSRFNSQNHCGGSFVPVHAMWLLLVKSRHSGLLKSFETSSLRGNTRKDDYLSTNFPLCLLNEFMKTVTVHFNCLIHYQSLYASIVLFWYITLECSKDHL